MRESLLAAACTLLCGCSGAFADGDGRAFGDDLGRFRVTALRTASTCGSGAVDAPRTWEFDVVLSRREAALYWNTGADAVEGALERDGKTFAFTSETVVNVPSAGETRASCAVVRTDDSSGKLDSAEAPRAFTGTLEYRYAPQGGSDCSAAIGESGFEALPCALRYSLQAAWASAR